MKNASTIIPCYAADTSGVCSAMYELGGMTVTHDASGCNSTYSTHDEPRWYDMRSDIFISALTEIDAIMGNDEKLIGDAVTAAKDLNPRFITICGSPMPMMTGVDFDAIAEVIQQRSGIRTFAMHTNGTRSYIEGASEAFMALTREYVHELPKTDGIGVNILGATPLDFSVNGTIESIREWLISCGFEVVCCMAMGSTLEDIMKAASARVNLVISYSGFAAAEYMYEQFGIPYVCGVPYGLKLPMILEKLIIRAAEDGTPVTLNERGGKDFRAVVIGESIGAVSLASALYHDLGESACVISTQPADGKILAEYDLQMDAEEDIKAALEELRPDAVIADPLYRYILPQGSRLVELPHHAFSGRCFQHKIPVLINRDIKEFF